MRGPDGKTVWLAELGPYVLTESQIFSRPARLHSVNKHFIMTTFLFHFHHFGGTIRRPGPRAFLVGPYVFSRPYHTYGPIRDLFSYSISCKKNGSTAKTNAWCVSYIICLIRGNFLCTYELPSLTCTPFYLCFSTFLIYAWSSRYIFNK